MVQVNGMRSLEQRFRIDRVTICRYSALRLARSERASRARRSMPLGSDAGSDDGNDMAHLSSGFRLFTHSAASCRGPRAIHTQSTPAERRVALLAGQ